MTYFQALIIAIIEGLTEFLPNSSTGHMILASSWMNIHHPKFAETFEIVIQLGAILAVLFLYIKRFFVGINMYLKLAVAFLPTGVIGLLAYKTIKLYLFNPYVVIWDAGFQLSFLSTFGLVYLSPILENIFLKCTKGVEHTWANYANL